MGSNHIHHSSESKSEHHSAALYRSSAFSFGALLARWLPLGVTRILAGWLGLIYALTHSARVTVVHKNLQLLDSTIERKSARQLYVEFGKTLADYFYIGTRSPAEAVKLVEEKVGYPYLEQFRDQGSGALMVTAHLGLFELGGLLTAHHGIPASVLTLPEPSNDLTEWRTHFRRRWNVETIEVGTDNFAFINIAKQLREGHFVAALIDRPTSQEPSAVTFPGGTASFSSGILLLAAQCRVPVIPAAMVRNSNGYYRAQVFEPIWIEPRGTRAETLRFYTQQIADILMPTLRAHPEQWYQFVPLT